MRILQIAPQVTFPLDDGGKIGIFNITKYLAQRGHEIDFICYRKQADYNSSFDALKKICNPFILDVQVDNNIWGVALNLFSPIPYNVSKFHKKILIDTINNLMNKNKYDVVHVDHLHLGYVVDHIKTHFNVPCVLREHNLEMRIMKRFSENEKNPLLRAFAKIQYKKFVKYEPELCRKYDNCMMITKEDEDEILSYDAKIKTTIIPAGVEENLLSMKKNNVEPYSLAHIGSLEWFPNADSLKWFVSEIFPKVLRSLPQVKLHVYGKGTKSFSIPAEYRDKIILHGNVPDLWSEVLTKDLAIIPLRIGGGMRIKVIELMAAGQNILSTSIGVEGIPVKNHEHILIENDAKGFADKIVEFLNHQFDNETMISKSKLFVKENFTWTKMAEKFEMIYQSV